MGWSTNHTMLNGKSVDDYTRNLITYLNCKEIVNVYFVQF